MCDRLLIADTDNFQFIIYILGGLFYGLAFNVSIFNV